MFYYLPCYNQGNLKKLFDWIAYTVQIVSFSSAIFAFGLLVSRVLILFKIGEQSYYYGVMNGRLWGIVNPNASAIFSYISIILAMYLIHKGSKYSVYLKLNKCDSIRLLRNDAKSRSLTFFTSHDWTL